MMVRSALVGAALLLAAPAMANGASCGYDADGCSVSPVTTKSCRQDIRGDKRELLCDTVALLKDVLSGKDRKAEMKAGEIIQDIQEINYDKSVLRSLR